MYQYFLKVHFSLFKTAYVEFIDWDNGQILYTKDFHLAGDFETYERACEVAHFLETEPSVKPRVKRVEIIEY